MTPSTGSGQAPASHPSIGSAQTGTGTVVRIGTRGSALAVAQTQTVASALAAKTGVVIEIVTVRTEGDTSTESLASLGGTGVFAGALREALVAGRVDVSCTR